MKTYGWLHLMMIMATILMLMAFAGCGKKADPIPPKEPEPRSLSGYNMVHVEFIKTSNRLIIS